MSPGTHSMETGARREGTSLFDRASLVFVLLVWLECLIATQALIANCASRKAPARGAPPRIRP